MFISLFEIEIIDPQRIGNNGSQPTVDPHVVTCDEISKGMFLIQWDVRGIASQLTVLPNFRKLKLPKYLSEKRSPSLCGQN